MKKRWIYGSVVLVAVAAAAIGWPACNRLVFNQAWQEAGDGPDTPEPQKDLLAGRWEGTWVSNEREESDKLRCIVTKLEDGRYEARFSATYAVVLTFNSTVELKVDSREPGKWTFSGQKDLGALFGGVYHYSGWVTEGKFYSTYTCQGDDGYYEMTPAATTQPASQPASTAPTK